MRVTGSNWGSPGHANDMQHPRYQPVPGPTEGRLPAMSDTPLTNDEGEVRELTAADIRRGRPSATALPELLGPELAATLLKRRVRSADEAQP